MSDKNKPFESARPLSSGGDGSRPSGGEPADLMAELAKFVSGGDAQPTAANGADAANDAEGNDVISKALEKSLNSGAASSPVNLADSDDGPLSNLLNTPFEDDVPAAAGEDQSPDVPEALAPLSVLRDSLGIPDNEAEKPDDTASSQSGAADFSALERLKANPFDTQAQDGATQAPSATDDAFAALGQPPEEKTPESSLFGGSKIPEPARDPGFPPMSVQNETSTSANNAFEDDLDLIGNLIEQNIDGDVGFGGFGGDDDLDGLALGPHTRADMSGLSQLNSTPEVAADNPFDAFAPQGDAPADDGGFEPIQPVIEPVQDDLPGAQNTEPLNDFPPIVQQGDDFKAFDVAEQPAPEAPVETPITDEIASVQAADGFEQNVTPLGAALSSEQTLDTAAPIEPDLGSAPQHAQPLGTETDISAPAGAFGAPQHAVPGAENIEVPDGDLNTAEELDTAAMAALGAEELAPEVADDFAPTDASFATSDQDETLAAIERLIEQSDNAAHATGMPESDVTADALSGLENLEKAAGFTPEAFDANAQSAGDTAAFAGETGEFGAEDSQLPSILRGPQQGQSLQDSFGTPQQNTSAGALGGVHDSATTPQVDFGAQGHEQTDPFEQESRSGFLVPVIAGVAVVALGVGAYMFLGNPFGGSDTPVTVAAQNLDVKKIPQETDQPTEVAQNTDNSATLTQITEGNVDTDANANEQFVSRDEQLDQTALAQNTNPANDTDTSPNDGGLTSRQVSTVVVRPDGSIVAPPADQVRQVASDTVTSLQSRSGDLTEDGNGTPGSDIGLRSSSGTDVENGRAVEQPSELDQIAQTILQDGAEQTQDLGNGEIVEQLDPTVRDTGADASTTQPAGDNLAVRSIEPIRIGSDGATQTTDPAPQPTLLANPIPVPGARPNVPAQLLASLRQRDVVAQTPSIDVAAPPVQLTQPAQQTQPTQLSTGRTGSYVQVSSQRSETAALQSYRGLQRRFPGLLSGQQPTIVRANLGDRGVYYRVRVYPGSSSSANQLCSALKSGGGDCFVGSN